MDISKTDIFMSMEFIAHIRSQHKFASPEHLAQQIENDCKAIKNILSK